MNKKIVLSSLVFCTTFTFAFDLNSFTKDIVRDITNTDQKQEKSSLSSLSEDTVSKGLKKALEVSVKYATKTLGKENGYLKNEDVKIPLPKNLQKAEAIIRKAGANKVVDDLIKSMNSAATKAAPQTAKIFLKAIEKMNINDAKNILAGDKNAATNYFKNNTEDALTKLIKPIINKTMQENSVSKYYDTFNSYYNQYGKNYVENSSLMNLAKEFGVDEYIPSSSDEKLDDYVTKKAIDGLFEIISQKEASIRQNPIEQSSSLLKKVFGN